MLHRCFQVFSTCCITLCDWSYGWHLVCVWNILCMFQFLSRWTLTSGSHHACDVRQTWHVVGWELYCSMSTFYRNWVFDTVRFSSTSSISLWKPRVRPILLSPVKPSSFLFYLHRANAKLFYVQQPITLLNSLHRPILICGTAQSIFGVSPITWRIAVLVLANAHRTRCTLPAALFYVHCNNIDLVHFGPSPDDNNVLCP